MIQIDIRSADLEKVRMRPARHGPITFAGLNSAGLIQIVTGRVIGINPIPGVPGEYTFRVTVIPDAPALLATANSNWGAGA
jgi:hypothetical protein